MNRVLKVLSNTSPKVDPLAGVWISSHSPVRLPRAQSRVTRKARSECIHSSSDGCSPKYQQLMRLQGFSRVTRPEGLASNFSHALCVSHMYWNAG